MDDKSRKFLDYINNPMSKESVMVVYDANGIKFEKCELYGDFVQSLFMMVFDTYMGDDVTNINEQIEHFNWCWNKNVLNFREEGMCFEGGKLYEYFFAYMIEVFYPSKKKPEDYTDKTSLRLWSEIFDYNRSKTNSDIDTFIEIYKIFENSLFYT